jgi:hypothetical protein
MKLTEVCGRDGALRCRFAERGVLPDQLSANGTVPQITLVNFWQKA